MPIKIKVKDPPDKTLVAVKAPAIGNDPIRNQMDARDHLLTFIGEGYTGGKMSDSQRGSFNNLANNIGVDKAQKMLSQVALFSQRPEVQSKSPAQRMQSFFEIGSNNPDIAPDIQRFKALNSGIGAAVNNSPWQGLAALTGRGLVAKEAPTPTQQKIKLLVSNLSK